MSPIDISSSLTEESTTPRAWGWPARDTAEACWRHWARDLSAWLSRRGLDAREALVILPVGAVLGVARAGWNASVGGWMPRIDTIASVAQGLAWSWTPPEQAAQPASGHEALPRLALDPVVDRLQAARSLGRQTWGQQWARRDRRGFEFALDQIVDAAHTWLRRMQAIEPTQRAAYADKVRAQLAASGGGNGPGGRERLLLTWAFEWAGHTAEQGLETDVLFGLRPSAFVVVTAGSAISPGTEAHLTQGVMRHLAEQGVPVTWFSAEPVTHGQEGTSVATGSDADALPARTPVVCPCTDAEDEAQQATAQVLTAVNEARAWALAQGTPQQPVALIALDRSLVRRARAMLEEAGARIADETGWRLSTTRAAAVMSRLLQASHPRASTDDLLDWLKSGWIAWQPDAGQAAATAQARATGQLEQWCRRHGMLGAWSLQALEDGSVVSGGGKSEMAQAMPPQIPPQMTPQMVPQGREAMPTQAAALWHWSRQVMRPLQALWETRRPRLQDWLLALRDALAAAGSLDALQADPAGEMALQALRFHGASQAADIEQAWLGLSSQTALDGRAFMRWVAAVLEGTTFRPAAPELPPDVVITPLARAVLRPFHAIVLPGADERQLGALPNQTGWLGTRLREAMDLATPRTQRAAQWDAFNLLMNRPGVVCLHRQAQGSEPLEPSAWLEKWSARQGVAIGQVGDARQRLDVPATPTRMPRPTLGEHAWALPTQVTATSYEALRQCPYRFFATGVLGLREQDELDEGLDRSDFGTWLHEVLRRFHMQRQSQLALSTPEEDVGAWLAIAQEVMKEKGLDRDSQRPYFLPFEADLDRLAEGYVQWLRGHEDEGWSVRYAEAVAERPIDIADGVTVRLKGQLDRVDTRHAEGDRQRFVLDYKTGNLLSLKAKVAAPLEDTQLAFYAALSDAGEPLSAAYLHLDARTVTQVEHADVNDSARMLLEGLSKDWIRLHEGAQMPALGEGSACAFCQARGLCRKDHWSPDEEAVS